MTLPLSSHACLRIVLSSAWETRTHSWPYLALTGPFPSQTAQPPNARTPGRHCEQTNRHIPLRFSFLDCVTGPEPCGSHIVSVIIPRSITLDAAGLSGTALSQHELSGLCKWLWGELECKNKHFSSHCFLCQSEIFFPLGPLQLFCSPGWQIPSLEMSCTAFPDSKIRTEELQYAKKCLSMGTCRWLSLQGYLKQSASLSTQLCCG